MPLKLDIIIWDDVGHGFLAVALGPDAAIALGKIMFPDEEVVKAGCVPLLNIHPTELLAMLPKELTVHLYDRDNNVLKNLRDQKQSLQ